MLKLILTDKSQCDVTEKLNQQTTLVLILSKKAHRMRFGYIWSKLHFQFKI